MALTNILEKITGSFCSCGNSNISNCYCSVHNENSLSSSLEDMYEELEKLKYIEEDYDEFKNKIKNLEEDNEQLQDQIDTLENENHELSSQVKNFEKIALKFNLNKEQMNLINENVKLQNTINMFRNTLKQTKKLKNSKNIHQVIDHLLTNSENT